MKRLVKEIIKFCFRHFIPKSIRERIRSKILAWADSQRSKPEAVFPSVTNPAYGKIYMPYYPYDRFAEGNSPRLYNSEGRKLDVWFIRDRIGAALPYSDSKYIAWDRYNVSLPVHFYCHGAVLETMGKPDHRYAWFIESESIIPEEYALFETHNGLAGDFDAVFTYSEKLLDSLPNAKFFPSCASMWYGKEVFHGVPDKTVLDKDAYARKTKNISMVCSAKKYTPMHEIRHRFAAGAQASGAVDVFGGFAGGQWMPYKSQSLADYRFQIVVENDIKPYYFTEKIIDCFAAMTIPVYLGASRIVDFFNPDGIITIEKDTPIESILKHCTAEFYEERLVAVKENFEKSLRYRSVDDLLYETFFMEKEA
ncbi:MAG: hypothetical protein II932_00895 [Treponema sp.]|nr:hypothetical protein [Treponema sp.]